MFAFNEAKNKYAELVNEDEKHPADACGAIKDKLESNALPFASEELANLKDGAIAKQFRAFAKEHFGEDYPKGRRFCAGTHLAPFPCSAHAHPHNS